MLYRGKVNALNSPSRERACDVAGLTFPDFVARRFWRNKQVRKPTGVFFTKMAVYRKLRFPCRSTTTLRSSAATRRLSRPARPPPPRPTPHRPPPPPPGRRRRRTSRARAKEGVSHLPSLGLRVRKGAEAGQRPPEGPRPVPPRGKRHWGTTAGRRRPPRRRRPEEGPDQEGARRRRTTSRRHRVED